MQQALAAIVGIIGWWLLFDAGWQVGLGGLLLCVSAAILTSRKKL